MINKEYRPEINGLRAVAVILVLLFHLEYDFAQAGFLGVDIFLVISGYLISRNILNDLNANTFSFITFYSRRFKRLFPALFITLTLSFIAGYITLTPVAFEQLSKSIISSVFFISNIFFFRQTGYFDTESSFKPLLHIWSLSLEEQFYFVWPLILFLLFLLVRKNLFIGVLIIAACSIVAAELYFNVFSQGVFYLLPFRFFEFLLGTLCVYLQRFRLKNLFFSELSVATGLFLILYSSFVYTVATPMPGVLSLIPCLGAMLVIWGGNTKYVGKILQNKVIELIGKSSYSAYLIHWPLIVYYKYYTLAELTFNSKMVIGLLSLLLGILMWAVIENPFRKMKSKIWKVDLVWVWMPLLMILLYYASHLVIKNEGYASRYSSEFVMTEKEIMECRSKYWENSNADKSVNKGTNKRNVIVIGNSFSIDLIYALRKNALEANVVSLQSSHKCFNFGAAGVSEEHVSHCNDIKKYNFDITNWESANAIYLFDHWPKLDLDNLRNMLLEIRSRSKVPIYVFGPKMVFSRPIPDIVHSCNSASAFAINKFAQQFAAIEDRRVLNDALLIFFKDKYWEQKNIFYIDVLDVISEDGGTFDIISRKNSKFLYFDPSHFTDQGALEFGEKLKDRYPELFNP